MADTTTGKIARLMGIPEVGKTDSYSALQTTGDGMALLYRLPISGEYKPAGWKEETETADTFDVTLQQRPYFGRYDKIKPALIKVLKPNAGKSLQRHILWRTIYGTRPFPKKLFAGMDLPKDLNVDVESYTTRIMYDQLSENALQIIRDYNESP